MSVNVQVGLDVGLPGLFELPKLRCVGDGIHRLRLVEGIAIVSIRDRGARDDTGCGCPSALVAEFASSMDSCRLPCVTCRFLCTQGWRQVGKKPLRQPPLGRVAATADLIAAARARVCADLGGVCLLGGGASQFIDSGSCHQVAIFRLACHSFCHQGEFDLHVVAQVLCGVQQ